MYNPCSQTLDLCFSTTQNKIDKIFCKIHCQTKIYTHRKRGQHNTRTYIFCVKQQQINKLERHSFSVH